MAGVERPVAFAALTTATQMEMSVMQSTLPSTELAREEQLGVATAAQLVVALLTWVGTEASKVRETIPMGAPHQGGPVLPEASVRLSQTMASTSDGSGT
jgi:acetaldehyde dehydrogenase (acetylating)